MRSKIVIAALWVIVALTGWPDFGRPGWWAAILLAAGVSVALLRQLTVADDEDRLIRDAAFHQNIDAVTVLRDGKFIGANQAAASMIGMTDTARFLSSEPARFAPPIQPDGTSSGERSRQMLTEALEKGSCRAEWMRQHVDGHQVPVEMTLVPVDIAGKRCVIAYYHDITDRVRLRRERNALLDTLTSQLDTLVGRVIQEVKATSVALTTDAAALTESLHHSNEQLTRAAAGSDATSGVVASIVGATEQLSGSTALIVDQVGTHRTATRAAASEGEVVNATVAQLAQSGERISDVAEKIANIASQTNMLALNATIEAARAGDAGRGFAVVANEVKSLAVQTANATTEVQTQVNQMNSAIQNAVAAFGRIGATIGQLTETAEMTGQALVEQGQAIKEIAVSTARAAEGVSDSVRGIGEVVTLTHRSEDVAEQVRVRAGQLDAEIGALRAEVERFRTAIVAA